MARKPPQLDEETLLKFRTLGLAPQGLKRCAGMCRRELPANTDWFDSDDSREDKLYPWCKQCRKEKREAKKLRAAATVLQALDQEMLKGLTRMRNAGGTNLPHISEVVQAAMEIYGGVNGFVTHMVANRQAAEPGSKVRAQYDQSLLRLMEVLSDSSKVSPPPELMDDDMLEKELEKRAGNVRRLRDRTTVEGSAEELDDQES